MLNEKAWYQSKTIWGALVSILASLLAGFDVHLDPAVRQEAVDAFYQASAVIGALVAIYGRLSAETAIRD